MSKLENDLLNLLDRLTRERESREKKLAKELLRIYEECRKALYIKFIEVNSGSKTLELMQIEGTIRQIEQQMKYYTNLTAQARQKAIDEVFLLGQQVGHEMLAAGATVGGYNISLVAGIGLIDRGMIEALIGDVPKLAGKVESDVLNRIRQELTKGAVMGESIPKIAKRILGTGLTQEGLKKPFPSLKTRCEVIARTEIIRASNTGYMDMADKAQKVIGEEIYSAWITAGDGRVDPPCPSLAKGTDSRYQSVAGMPGVYRRNNLPVPTIASHPRCRCRLVPVLRSWVKSGALNLSELRGRTA